ncbi:MAG: hypothetical protein GY705_13630 [Bacteroidetes bacterium]|nr:hypothetical protein [Bacteroidota bacterium]
METTIPIKINLPLTFGVEKGQIETFHQEGFEAQIIDIDFNYDDLIKATHKAVDKKIEEIKAAIEESLESEREGI